MIVERWNEEDRPSRGKRRRWQNYGQIVDDTDTIWCGGDVSVGPRTVLLVI